MKILYAIESATEEMLKRSKLMMEYDNLSQHGKILDVTSCTGKGGPEL